MTDEVKAALERLQRYYAVKSPKEIDAIYPGAKDYTMQHVSDDETTLAEAFLAEHPSDDGDSVTEEEEEVDSAIYRFACLASYRENGDVCLLVESQLPERLCAIKTRGQLRRLVSALEG